MVHRRDIIKFISLWVWFAAGLSGLSACATRPIAPVSTLEALDGAVTVPYRISSSGRFLIDVAINDGPPRPMSVDTGASVSVIYSDFAQSSDLKVSDKTRFVRGLVGQGDRPVIEDVTFQIGARDFPLNQVVMLETPGLNDEAIGLVGGDILRSQLLLFNAQTAMATFLPRQNVDRNAFAGWRSIPLQTLSDSETNSDLYFSHTEFDGQDIPVLIDTGSNLNFINWKFATMDEEIRRLERDMIRNGTLQGALETTAATLETVLRDLELGRQHWEEVSVVVIAFDGLTSIAPVDEPMMVAGANLFTPHTIAFDLEGLRLYLRPDGG